MEKFIELLEIVGVSILLALLVFCVFLILITVIHIVSMLGDVFKVGNPFKIGKIVYSPLFGEGKIGFIKEDGSIIVNFTTHTQIYDSKGRAVVQTMFRKGLKATLKDNIKALND